MNMWLFEKILEIPLLLVVFGGLPAVLWLIPKTRKSGGSLVAALKIVPVFWCVFFVTVTLAGWIPGAGRLIPAVCGLFCGTAAVYFLVRLVIQKHYAEKKMLALWCVLLVIPAAVAGLMVYMAASFAITVNMARGGNYRSPWKNCGLPIQTEDGEKVFFCARSIHPFLAEYDYRIAVQKSEKTAARWLFCNTGGRTLFHLYRLPDGDWILADKMTVYLVAVKPFEIYEIFARKGELYRVPVPNEEITSWGIDERDGVVRRNYNGKCYPAEKIGDALLSGGVFSGYLDSCGYQTGSAPELRFCFDDRRELETLLQSRMKQPPPEVQNRAKAM